MPASPSQATVEHPRAMLRFGPLAPQGFSLTYQRPTSRDAEKGNITLAIPAECVHLCLLEV